MKKILKILILLLLFIPTISNASDNYKINEYNLEISINEENEYKYNESININPTKDTNIIIKEIDYNSKNIRVNDTYTLESNKTKLIKINDIKDSKNITYQYKIINKLQNKNIYNVKIGNDFNNDLNNIDFEIKLPYDINDYNIDFYLNDEKLNKKELDYTISTDTIKGKIKNIKENDELYLRVNYGRIYINPLIIIALIIPPIITLICYIIWYIYGKDLRFKITKKSKMPYGLNPIDVALIYNGSITNKDAVNLLLELANKGYINITESENNKFTITRNKDYDGRDFKEANFLKALFKKSSKVTITEYIEALKEDKEDKTKKLDNKLTPEMIYPRFKRAFNNINSIIESNEEKNKYFEIKSHKKKYILLFAIAIILITVTSIPFVEINRPYLLPISLIFSIVTLFVLQKFINAIDKYSRQSKVIILTILSLIAFLIIFIPSLKRNVIYIIVFMLSCLCVSIILILYKYMPKRTIYGSKKYHQIEGFKLFLDSLKNKELNNILEINPNYLYDILPYSYILNREDIVFKKLKELCIPEPKWYKINEYTTRKFKNSIERLNEALEDKEPKE